MTALLPGEEIKVAPSGGPAIFIADDAINEKYTKGEVRIVTEMARYPLNSVPAMIASGDYFLQPTYQRRHRWSAEKKSRLIESFVMNVPIPPVFLYEYEYSRYEVMDGLQRLSTIADFYTDHFALDGLSEWPELNGRFYSTLPASVRAGIDRRYLSSIILLQETAKSPEEAAELKQLVFERINSGGERLTPQESRNAIHPGPMNDLCLHLSRRDSLCLTWGIPTQTPEERETGEPDEALLDHSAYREMADVELVLRFFAFRQDPQYLAGALRDYFDLYQRAANKYTSEVLSDLGETFSATIDLAYEVLGAEAFWLFRLRGDRWNWFARPTTVAYDTIMYVLSHHLDKADMIRDATSEVRDGMSGFYRENYASFAGRYTNPSNIVERRDLFETFLLSKLA